MNSVGLTFLQIRKMRFYIYLFIYYHNLDLYTKLTKYHTFFVHRSINQVDKKMM